MLLPPYVIAPMLSAVIYCFAALALKRATADGAGPWRVSFVTNWIQALFFLPFWFLEQRPMQWEMAGPAAVTGLVFFSGQVLTFLALSRGDVSVTTPILGTKVVFVAFLTMLFGEHLTWPIWGAALLTIAATALLGGGKSVAGPEELVRSFIYGFGAAASFALTDVLAQRWAPALGFGHFAPVLFGTVAVCSLGLVPFFREPLRALPREAWRWIILGALLLSLQASGIAFAIMSYGQATLVNIVYATRGLWSVVAVWAVGHWFGNEERGLGRTTMVRRLVGAGLLVGAVLLAVWARVLGRG